MPTNKAQILIVEDQNIVALDIQNRLKNLKYRVAGIASSGAGAIKKAEETLPDLILMDIMLKGDMDGINAAKEIKKRINVPIVYLTAYADDDTLERAKVTQPFGYILKPFDEKELYTTIEMSLYRHKIEMEVKEKEEWFESALMSSENSIIITNRKGNILFVNSALLELTKLKNYELVNKNINDVIDLLDINNKKVSFNFNNIIENNKIELILKTKNIKEKFIKTYISSFGNNTDKKSFIFTIIDTTKEKITFNDFNNALVLDSTSNLINNLADSFTNVLTSIVSNISLLRSNVTQETNLENLNEIENISFSFKEQLQKLFLISNNKFLNNKVLINKIVKNFEKKYAYLYPKVETIFEYPSEDLYVEGNDLKIEKALKNILDNAFEALNNYDNALVTFKVEYLNVSSMEQDYVLLNNSKEYIKITIKDTGNGISLNFRDKIFYSYFSTKDKHDGLGLTISLAIIKAHKGFINFKSEENNGSIFYIYLPRV